MLSTSMIGGSANTELQSIIELRAKASEIAVPKPDLDAK